MSSKKVLTDCTQYFILRESRDVKPKRKKGLQNMYNFDKRAEYIVQEGLRYGVTIEIVNNGNSPRDAVMTITSENKGSISVEKYLNRIMGTWNKHVKQGF